MHTDVFNPLEFTYLAKILLIFAAFHGILNADTLTPSATTLTSLMCTKIRSLLSMGKYRTTEVVSNVTYVSSSYSQNFLAYSPADNLLIFIEPKRQLYLYNFQTLRLLVSLPISNIAYVASCTSLSADNRRDLFFITESRVESDRVQLRICEMSFQKRKLNFTTKRCIATLMIRSAKNLIRINGFTIKRNHAETEKSIVFLSTNIGIIHVTFNTNTGVLIHQPIILNDTLNTGNIVATSSDFIYYANREEDSIHELRIARDFRIRHGKIIKSSAIIAPYGLIADECDHLYIATKSMILIMYFQKYMTIRSVLSKSSQMPITLEKINSTVYVYATVKQASKTFPLPQWIFNVVSFSKYNSPPEAVDDPDMTKKVSNSDKLDMNNINEYNISLTSSSSTPTHAENKTPLTHNTNSHEQNYLSEQMSSMPTLQSDHTKYNNLSINESGSQHHNSVSQPGDGEGEDVSTSLNNTTVHVNVSMNDFNTTPSNYDSPFSTPIIVFNDTTPIQNTTTTLIELIDRLSQSTANIFLLTTSTSTTDNLSDAFSNINNSQSTLENSEINISNNTNSLIHQFSENSSNFNSINFTSYSPITLYENETFFADINNETTTAFYKTSSYVENESLNIIQNTTSEYDFHSPLSSTLLSTSSLDLSLVDTYYNHSQPLIIETTIFDNILSQDSSDSRNNDLNNNNNIIKTTAHLSTQNTVYTTEFVSTTDFILSNITNETNESNLFPSLLDHNLSLTSQSLAPIVISSTPFTFTADSRSPLALSSSKYHSSFSYSIPSSIELHELSSFETHSQTTTSMSEFPITTDSTAYVSIDESDSTTVTTTIITSEPFRTSYHQSTTALPSTFNDKSPSTESSLNSKVVMQTYKYSPSLPTSSKHLVTFELPSTLPSTTSVQHSKHVTNIATYPIRTSTGMLTKQIDNVLTTTMRNNRTRKRKRTRWQTQTSTQAYTVLHKFSTFPWSTGFSDKTPFRNASFRKLTFVDLFDHPSPSSTWNLSSSADEDIILDMTLPSSPSMTKIVNLNVTNVEANHLTTNIINMPVNFQVDKIDAKKFSLLVNQANNTNQSTSNIVIGRIRTEEFEANLTKSDNTNILIEQVDAATAVLEFDSQLCTNANNFEINLNLSKTGTIRYGNQTPIHIGPVFTQIHVVKQSCNASQPLKLLFDICKNDNPCLNGGRCKSIMPNDDSPVSSAQASATVHYQCTCPMYVSGEHCQELEYPFGYCLNGDLTGSIGLNNRSIEQCLCYEGFQGTHCENNIDDCANVKCSDQGICVDGINSYQCVCFQGYHGTQCETKHVQTILVQFVRKSFAIVAIICIASLLSLALASDLHTYLTTKKKKTNWRPSKISQIPSEPHENSVLLSNTDEPALELINLSIIDDRRRTKKIQQRLLKRTTETNFQHIPPKSNDINLCEKPIPQCCLLPSSSNQTIL